MDNNAAKIGQQPTANSYNHVLVSIIIPAYNTAKYIHRAIESSLRQTHTNVEVIVVDDGSKDNTLEVAKSYAERDSRVRVFHKENGGVSSARNMGIREAHGEYIIFLDSDDWLEDCAVEILLGEQLSNPDKLIKTEKWYNITFDSEHRNFLRLSMSTGATSRILSVEEALSKMDKLNVHSMFLKIFSANIIKENNIMFSEKLNVGEDTFFVFEYISRTNGMVCVNKAVWNILAHSDSLSRTRGPARKTNEEDFHQTMIDYPNNTETIRELMKVRYARRKLSSLNRMLNERLDNKKVQDMRRKAMKYINEFFRSGSMSFVLKIFYLLEVFLPIPLARVVSDIHFLIRKLQFKTAQKLQGEVIAIW